MDGVHDLGGKEGFGPIDVNSPPFSHEWERRQWAISTNAWLGGNIDRGRHILELLPPGFYLTASYFEKWCLRDLTKMVAGGIATEEEVLAGHAGIAQPAPEARDLDAAIARVRAARTDFSRPIDAAPAFAIGATITTLPHSHAGHTRLPAYARGRTGTVIAHHGAHLYPDDVAENTETTHHLYTVEFTAPALWGDAADPRDTVLLDLWEPYFVRA